MTEEIWKPVKGYDIFYEVSDAGNVRSLRSGQLRKLHTNDRGYVKINLSGGGTRKEFSVHRLVMEAFVGHQPLTVDHLDGDKSNNRLSNLQYMTQRDNIVKSKKNKYGFTGVSTKGWKTKEPVFTARIYQREKYVVLGSFKTAEEASAAYQNARRALEGRDLISTEQYLAGVQLGRIENEQPI